jgi:hypothetical protein
VNVEARAALEERLAQQIHTETCPDWSCKGSSRPADFAAVAAVLQLLEAEGHLQDAD